MDTSSIVRELLKANPRFMFQCEKKAQDMYNATSYLPVECHARALLEMMLEMGFKITKDTTDNIVEFKRKGANHGD